MMDDVIEESTGAQYQATRSQYAALKSLEDDLVRKFQQDARSIGGGLPEYTGAFASGDIIGSALSLDPAQFAKGATLGTFSLLKRKLSNPERFLRRSFDLIDDVPSDLSLRIWGGSKALSEKEAKLAGDVAESIKNPAIGMSIKNVADDPSFNQGVTPNLVEEAKKYKSADEFVKAQPIVYHGTPTKFDKFDTNISEGNATWFTADKQDIIDNTAGAVQPAGSKLNIMERYPKPNLKLATPKQADEMFTDQLISEGYVGVKYPKGEYGDYEWTKLFNPNEDTLTKSQLTDIWNKANGK
jgi:hypothetical protein